MKFLIVVLPWVLIAQEFPISAYQCVNTNWFQGAGEDSLGLNIVHYGHLPANKNANLAALDSVAQHNLDVVLYYATKGGKGRDDLFWYCCLHWGQWEAEDSANFLSGYWHGDVVVDPFARNDTAFVAFADSLNTCTMLRTKADQIRFYEDTLYFDIIYHLKIDSLSLVTLDDTVSICSLYVTKPQSVLLTGKKLTIGDFSSANQYKVCTLTYYWCKGPKPLYYGLYFFDNSDLWCDYIEAKDRYIDLLKAGSYNSTLNEITAIYDDHSALAYYYLLDEPPMSYLAANRYIMEYLGPPTHKPGIQAVSYKGYDWYKTYVDSVDPQVLAIDYYPLKGEQDSNPTPEDSGIIFQGRLDTLCMVLGEARKVAMDAGKDFWFICQSFGQYDSVTGQTMWCREPTIRELKCMVWLGLAYGAKGINHFLYRIFSQKVVVDRNTVVIHNRGLTANGPPRYPSWTAAKDMNFVLRDIGTLFMSLKSDKVFKASDGIPQGCIIKNLNIWNGSDTLMQIGTCHKTNNPDDKYFVIVNRHCLPSETLEVIVELEDTLRYLYDCYTGETITYEAIIEEPITYGYRIKLQPGQGRLFRVIPFNQ